MKKTQEQPNEIPKIIFTAEDLYNMALENDIAMNLDQAKEFLEDWRGIAEEELSARYQNNLWNWERLQKK